MKKTIMMIIGLILFAAVTLSASVNIAYIDTDRVMLESEDTREAQQLFQSEQQAWEQEIKELDENIYTLEEDYAKKESILSESGKQEAQDKINDLKMERDNMVKDIFGDNGQAMQKNAELLEPILEKLQSIIEQISTEQNIDLVLDASTGGILYAVPALDITEDVIIEMNKLTDDSGEDN